MILPSVSWAESNKLKLVRFQHLRKNFIKTKATELANKLIIDPIVEEMKQNNVSRKIYEQVIVKDVILDEVTGTILIKIHCEYFSEEGFDVAVAREYGTEDHMIRPKGKENGGADSLSWIQGGMRRFSKGHMVSGLPRLNIIERRVEEGEYELQRALYVEYRRWKGIFGFSSIGRSVNSLYPLESIYS
tara:strand:+ start:78 stop:641 length:564 start_codon:yes stop_codon:yes gene_type:complete